jgi:hypothetical protein
VRLLRTAGILSSTSMARGLHTAGSRFLTEARRATRLCVSTRHIDA